MSGHNVRPIVPTTRTQGLPHPCSVAQLKSYAALVSKFRKEKQGTPRAAWQINLAEAVLSSE